MSTPVALRAAAFGLFVPLAYLGLQKDEPVHVQRVNCEESAVAFLKLCELNRVVMPYKEIEKFRTQADINEDPYVVNFGELIGK